MISDHVVDLDTSKKLAPYLKGYESVLYHFKYPNSLPGMSNDWGTARKSDIAEMKRASFGFLEHYPALLLSEVLAKLPDYIEERGIRYFRTQDFNSVRYCEWRDRDAVLGINFIGDNLATACAELLLYLHQNGYMEGK